MPWVAKTVQIPKLTGGFDWRIGNYYQVTKRDHKTVYVVDLADETENAPTTTISKDSARELFDKPVWVDKFDADTIADLSIKDNLKKQEQNKSKVQWKQ